MDSIKIRPATEGDAVALARIHYDALGPFNDLFTAFFANDPRVILPKSTAAALGKPDQIFFVAVDTLSGEAVGFVRYFISKEVGAGSSQPDPAENNGEGGMQPDPSLFAPKEHLKDLWAQFNESEDMIDACYEAATKGQKHACEFQILT